MASYLANLDFDDRLAGRAGGAQPRPGPPDENAVLWRLIANEGDTILVPGLPKPFHAPALGPLAGVQFRAPNRNGEEAFTAWGVDGLAQRLAGNRISSDIVSASRRMNDRLFAFQIDPLPGSYSTADADFVLSRAAQGERLMLKPRHGGFGRGLRRILGVETDANLQGWVRARCREGGLIVEPLIDQFIRQWGRHWDILGDASSEAEVHHRGTTELECDAHGQFSASTFRIDTNTAGVCESATLPHEIVAAAYRGPVTIDQCCFVQNGVRTTAHCRDINARWSVGRLVMILGQRLNTTTTVQRLSTGKRETLRDSRHQNEAVIPALSADKAPRWKIRWE